MQVSRRHNIIIISNCLTLSLSCISSWRVHEVQHLHQLDNLKNAGQKTPSVALVLKAVAGEAHCCYVAGAGHRVILPSVVYQSQGKKGLSFDGCQSQEFCKEHR